MKFSAHFGCVKWIDDQQSPAKAKFGHVIGFVAFPETLEQVTLEIPTKKTLMKPKKADYPFLPIATKVEYRTKKVILMAMVISKGMKKPVMVQADLLEYV